MEKTQEQIAKDEKMKYIIASLLTIAIAAFISSFIVENTAGRLALNVVWMGIILMMVW